MFFSINLCGNDFLSFEIVITLVKEVLQKRTRYKELNKIKRDF